MQATVRIFPITPHRGIAIFLPSQDHPKEGQPIQFATSKLSIKGTFSHGYIDFDTSIPTETVTEGVLSWE